MGTDHQVRKRLFRGVDKGLVLGQMGRGDGWIVTMATRLERALQDAVLASGGDLDVVAMATIQSACRWERLALWAQREARQKADTFGPDTALAYHKTIPWASTQRDTCIRRLKLHRDEAESIFDALYRPLPDVDPDGNGNGSPRHTSSDGVCRDVAGNDDSPVPSAGGHDAASVPTERAI